MNKFLVFKWKYVKVVVVRLFFSISFIGYDLIFKCLMIKQIVLPRKICRLFGSLFLPVVHLYQNVFSLNRKASVKFFESSPFRGNRLVV